MNDEWQEKIISIFYASIIVLFITGLSFFESFAWSNEWIRHIFENLNPNPQTHMKVLVIEAPVETPDETWLTLLDILEKKKAKQVVFTFIPKKAPREFFCRAQQYGNVFFARSLNADGLEALPKWHADCQIQFGLVARPPQIYAIHNKQHTTFEINEQSYPALEIVAAQHFLEDTSNLPKTPYHLQFGTGLDNLPQLTLQRVLAGGVVSDLVEQRSVIIGLAQPSNIFELYTP